MLSLFLKDKAYLSTTFDKCQHLFVEIFPIVLIVYFMGNKTTQTKTIILISLFCASVISFIVNTVLYFLGTPSLKNK